MCDECGYEKSVRIIDWIEDQLGEIPERGEEFANSVSEKITSMREWIVNNDHVTESQSKAIVNMAYATGKWTRTTFNPDDFDKDSE